MLKGYSLSVLLAFLFVFVEPAPLWASNKKGWIESALLQRFCILFLIYILALKRFLKVWLYISLGQRCLTITSNLWPDFSRMLYKKIAVGILLFPISDDWFSKYWSYKGFQSWQTICPPVKYHLSLSVTMSDAAIMFLPITVPYPCWFRKNKASAIGYKIKS